MWFGKNDDALIGMQSWTGDVINTTQSTAVPGPVVGTINLPYTYEAQKIEMLADEIRSCVKQISETQGEVVILAETIKDLMARLEKLEREACYLL